MKLNLRTTFKPPSPEERRRSIAALRWMLFDMFDYEPHTAQMDFHESLARFRMTIAGTRGGKSRSAGEEVIPYLFAGATRVWIVGQNYSLTEKEFRYVSERMTSPQVRAMLGGNDCLESHVYNESQGNMYLRTKWGAEVKCVSLERERGAFGEELDLIVLSEAAQIKRPKMLYERILRGRLASRLGDMIVPTTPAGKTNMWDEEGWLFDMYRRGYDENEPNYYTREWPSWENPTFMEDIEELRREIDPKVFAEQYEGQFMIFSGAVYNDFDDRCHVIRPFKIPDHWLRYEAIDPGFSGQFVWLSAVVSEDGTLYIVDEYSDKEMIYKDRVREIKNHRCEQYGIPHDMWDIYAKKKDIRTLTSFDPEDPQCLAEFTMLGLPGIKANNNVQVGVDRVSRRLKHTSSFPPRLYITSNCMDTIEAFKFHSWGDKTSADVRKPANDKWKHWMDCTRYICAGNLVESPPPKAKPQEEEQLWDIMQELIEQGNKNPADYSAYDRRQATVLN